MLYGTLVSMNLRVGGGFDRLSPNGGWLSLNGGFFSRWVLSPLGLTSSPFGLSLSKPSRHLRQP